MTIIRKHTGIAKYIILFLFLAAFQNNLSFAATAPKTAVVYVEDYHFSPTTIIISRGQKVLWINKGKKDHTITSNEGYFDSGHIHPGASVSYTFNKPGTYYYYCRPHTFFIFGMKGKVIVK